MFDPVEEIRDFNRFYTRRIGLLAPHLPGGALTLQQARLIYELARGGEQSAADIVRRLQMDKAHVSRILARFRERGLLSSRRSPEHGRRQLLRLSAAGRALFDALEQGTRRQLETLIAPLSGSQARRLVGAMQEIRALMREPASEPAAPKLRALAPGDIGWIIHRQMLLYRQEYGWDMGYEGLISTILGEFVANFDPAREDAWVAERAGLVLGSVFLVKSDRPGIAKLRLLYVEPAARGLGLGRQLVACCIARARALGYREITLWTNDVLVAARHIYQSLGFVLLDEAPHHSFGHDLVGQNWTLAL